MAKRRVKKRTHAGAQTAAPGNAPPKPGQRTPKSMVIRIGAGEVGPSVSQLVRDVRSMMEPETATRLKERRSNKLRDYTTMAGPLGVTHLLLFSRSRNGNTNLRLALAPRGPTLHFRVEEYSLCKDVHRSMKRPRSGGNEYPTAPLLVMNHFQGASKGEETNGKGHQTKIPQRLESLTTTVFQSLFPPINPANTPLNGIKRVLLLDRAPPDSAAANYVINLRHYAIETRTAKSVPKPLRRLDAAEKLSRAVRKHKHGALPNLGKLGDVADYLLDPHVADGFTSGSESEPETDAEVEVLAASAAKLPRRKRREDESAAAAERRDGRANVQRKGVKLHELGPRLRLRLSKVEEGVCGGKVMWHEYIHKSREELKDMEKIHEQRRRAKEARRAEQRANVERKKAERKANGEPEGEDGEDEEMEDLEDDEWDDDGDEVDDGGVDIRQDEDEEMADEMEGEDEELG